MVRIRSRKSTSKRQTNARTRSRDSKLIEPVLFVVTLKTRVTKNHAPLASICSFRAFFFLPAALAVSPLLTCTLFLAFRKRETIVFPLLLPSYQPSRVLFRKIFDTHTHTHTHILPFFLFHLSFLSSSLGSFMANHMVPYEYDNCLLNKIKRGNIQNLIII